MSQTVGVLEIQLMAGMARLSKDMAQAERVVSESTGKMEKSVTSLQNQFNKLGMGLSIGLVMDQFRRMTDSYIKVNAQMRIATGSQEDYAKGMSEVMRISTAAQSGIEATTMLYTRLTNSLKQHGATQQQVGNITEAVSLGLKAYGATTAEAASAMLQLSQAFGSNRLGGEEFRAVSEAMPNMMQKLADSMNVPKSAIRQLSIEGKITSEVMMKAWGDPAILDGLRKQAEMTRTITGEVTVFRNNLTMLVGEFMNASGSTRGITDSIKLMSETVTILAENLKTLTLAVTVLGLAYAGKFAVELALAAEKSIALAEATAINTALNLKAAEAAHFGAKAALAQGAANAIATGNATVATAANVAYRKSAIELAEAQAAASASTVSGITAVGVAIRTAVMAHPIIAATTAIVAISAAIANWDKIIASSKESLRWFREDFLGGMEFLAGAVGISFGELVQKLSLLANITWPQLKSGEFKKQWDELGNIAEQSRIDLAARIAGLDKQQIDRDALADAERFLQDRTAWNKLHATKEQQYQTEIDELYELYSKLFDAKGISNEEQLKLTEEYYVKQHEIDKKYREKDLSTTLEAQHKKFRELKLLNDEIGMSDEDLRNLKKEKELADLERQRLKVMEITKDNHALQLEEMEKFAQAKKDIEERYQKQSNGLVVQSMSLMFKALSTMRAGDLANATASAAAATAGLARTSRAAFEINKVATLANIAAKAPGQIMDAWDSGFKETGSVWGGAAYAVARGLEIAALLSAAQGSSFGGGGSVPPSSGGTAGIPASSSAGVTTTPPATGTAAATPQQINLTLVGVADENKPQFTYNQIVNELIPMLNEASGNGVEINVTVT